MVRGRKVLPPPAARQCILIGTGLVKTVVSILLHDNHTQSGIDIGNGMSLVRSTPDGNRRMVAQTTHLITGIRLESLVISHIVISNIEPEVIPNHHAVTVAIVVELLISNTPRP